MREQASACSLFLQQLPCCGGIRPHFLFEASKRKCAAPGGKEKMLVPKSCLAAGSGKNGGFSRGAPDICCSVSALGAGTGFRKLQVVSPRRNSGTYPGYSTNWFSLFFPLPLLSRKIQRSGSGRRNQWNTGDGNTARPAGRDSKREAGPVRFHPRHCTQRSNTRHKRLLRSRYSAPG